MERLQLEKVQKVACGGGAVVVMAISDFLGWHCCDRAGLIFPDTLAGSEATTHYRTGE